MNENIAAVNRWGYWATSAWAVVAFLVGQFAALAVIVLWRSGRLDAVLDTPYDGILVTLFILISNPISVAVLWLAVRLAKSNAVDYLALHWPNKRDVVIWPDRAGRHHRAERRVALSQRARAGHDVSDAILLHGAGGRLAAGDDVRGDHRRAGGRGDHVSRISVRRLRPIGTRGVAGDRRDLDSLGGAAHPIRLDRHIADLRDRPVSRLDALAQQLDAADVPVAHLVQSRRHV